MLARLLEWTAVLAVAGVAGWWMTGIPLVMLLGILGVFAGIGLLIEWFHDRTG